MEYQGSRSWNSWNVGLWINNTESIYFYAVELVKQYGREKAARIMARQYNWWRTPDGARYNRLCIYEALEGME